MCGISGTFNFGDYFMEPISEMVEKQTHRGPDAWNITVLNENHSWWFGHNRLAIIDLTEGSRQPVIGNDRYCMIYNGEWFDYQNFSHLPSDTLTLYNEICTKGFREAVKLINGQFAVAVFDKEEQMVYMAVDPFNQKSLHYFHDGKRFAIASEPSALTVLKKSWELDREALDQMFILGATCFDRTLFKGIKKLPGSYMAMFDLKTGELKLEKWWSIAPEPIPDLEELIIDSIEKVKVADVPVNIYLSGGIDSTLVASRFGGLHAIHLESEEKKYAQMVADRNGIKLHVCPLDFDRDKVLQDYARKTGDCAMSAIQPYITSQQAGKFGKVAVIANGADELFYGYNRTHDPEGLRHMMRPGYESIMADLERLYLDEYELCSPDMFERLLELRIYIQNDLNKTLDFASMCNSVEVRSPFLDPRLINAALFLSYNKHTSKAYGGKTILKKMLAKLGYSHEFLTRPKVGFSIPKHLQCSGEDLQWCVDNGFVKIRKDWSARDRIYVEATASAFKSWWQVWNEKIN